MKKVLVTGGAGFIAHHIVDYILKNTDWNVTIVDRLDHSGNLNRLAEIGAVAPRVKFVYHDLRSGFNPQLAAQIGEQDYFLHLAAGTHVDRSIVDPLSFVYDNVVSTCNLLEVARTVGCEKFNYFSTDEVFGPAPKGVKYKEWDRYNSGNPYAATKAGGEELALAFQNTYKLPVFITHTMNVIGERQHPEKFVPMTIKRARDGELVTVHSDHTRTIPGSRFYIHARHVAGALLFLLDKAVPGDKYNIVGQSEVNNLELAQMIANVVGKELKYELVDFHSSRPGHDLRYALDGEKLEKMGWTPPENFETVLKSTVEWTLTNKHWLL
jgi:dTDP-glucose 4,6-dehydratase